MNHRLSILPPVAVLIVVAIVSSGCSPSLSPLYRDYQAPKAETPLDDRIATALLEAGWDTLHTDTPNAITTESRTLSRWGLYRVTASLEVTPLGPDHVRVFVHPFRRYVTGGKGKIPFLSPSIRSKFLPELNDALENQGLMVVGTPIERDEETVQ